MPPPAIVHYARNEWGRTACGLWVIPGTNKTPKPGAQPRPWNNSLQHVTCKTCKLRPGYMIRY